MNQEKIGKFILSLRTNKHMTQKELADLLNVTDRAISHWEHGRCLPDVYLFKSICDIFDISINELISGERIKDNELLTKTDENIVQIVDKYQRGQKRMSMIIIILVIIILFITSIIGLTNSRPQIINYTELNELDNVKMNIINVTRFSAKVVITDYSYNKYIYGTSYLIEKKQDGQWVELPKKNKMYFTTKAYYPDSNGKLEFDINWGYGYGELNDGYYRIVKYAISRNDKCLDECLHYYFSAEFEIIS